jgi:hypothetical protein
MGLDMYLKARISAYKPYQDPVPPARAVLERAANELGLPKSDNIDGIELSREIGYWRKANQIHAWFVEHVQRGEDECKPHYVGREQLRKLRDVCERVLGSTMLVDGIVQNGSTLEKLGTEGVTWKPNMEKGKRLADPTLAKELLPTQEGFFFGSTDYDQWYASDLELTIEICDRCLALPADFEFEYCSSW